MKIVRKAKLKDKILKMELPRDEEGNLSLSDDEYGVMMIFEVLEVVPEIETELFELLADVAGVSVEDMQNDEFELLPNVIKHLQKQEKLSAFLKQAFKSAT